MEFGYCRKSRKEQNIERQIRNILLEYPSAKIYKETYTGTTIERPEWNKLVKRAAKGDIIVFDSVSRMSRDAEEGFRVYEELMDRGVELIFLKEPHVNTNVYKKALEVEIEKTGNEIADEYIAATNRVLMILARQQIQIAFEQAEKEVTDLHQRTSEGIKTARLNGKQIGRPIGSTGETQKAKKCKEMILKYSRDFSGTLNDLDVICICRCSRKSYYKYKKELKS